MSVFPTIKSLNLKWTHSAGHMHYVVDMYSEQGAIWDSIHIHLHVKAVLQISDKMAGRFTFRATPRASSL